MKFILQGEITFSKDIKEAQEDIKKFIEDANSELLLKGVPEGKKEEGAQITDWEIDGSILKVTIESGHRVRAHDAILRMKKPLTQLLGQKYHMGIRKIFVPKYKTIIPTGKDKYDVDFDLAKKLPQITDFKINDSEVIVEIHDMEEADLRNHIVNRILKYVTAPETGTEKSDDEKNSQEAADEDKPTDILTRQVTKVTPGKIIARSEKRTPLFEGDPTEESIKQGWVKKFPGRGQWTYAPPMVALQRALEEILLENIAIPLGFEEYLFPKLIPIPIMHKMRYLEGLPEGMYYCSAPKRDPATFEKFKNELIISKEVPIDLLKEGLKDPGYVIAPAQCEPFYEFLSHEVVNEQELPIKAYDKSGWTYRWEAGGAKGLDRVHEFQRTELVWLGTPEQTNEIRDQTLELSHQIADKMELEWYTEIGDDPFYLEGRKVEERGIEFPDVPKYEMRLSLPGQDKGVAVVSANVHGTHFIEGFSIKEARNQRIWTGCTGIGLSRWVFGFLAQKGFDTTQWPELVREKVEMVNVPKMVTWP
ncbi:MAG: serine--tRNA ligase [Methanobacteriaceae archaeon]|nr:serine--tRNA ligase [Methanobacteriaceae archaeon]